MNVTSRYLSATTTGGLVLMTDPRESHYHALSGSSHVPTDIPRNIIAGGPAESTLAPLFVLDIVYKEVESHRESYASLVYNPCVE